LKAEGLVDAAALERHLGDPSWIVFDVRHDLAQAGKGRAAYAEGHVPGAYFLHLDEDLSAPKTGRNGRHPLPAPGDFAAKLNRCGVKATSQVVAYDDSGGSYAVRLWWMLHWLGHERVAVLDGGWKAWMADARPVSRDVPPERKGDFVPRPLLGGTVDAAFVDRFREDPSLRLVDARAADRFAGNNETIDPVAGHVPGAVNRFWQSNLGPDGRFKAPDALRREFETLLAGTDPSATVHMCGSGVTACHNAFAMALAGLPTGRVYPGSWSEWCADPTRPVARG